MEGTSNPSVPPGPTTGPGCIHSPEMRMVAVRLWVDHPDVENHGVPNISRKIPWLWGTMTTMTFGEMKSDDLGCHVRRKVQTFGEMKSDERLPFSEKSANIWGDEIRWKAAIVGEKCKHLGRWKAAIDKSHVHSSLLQPLNQVKAW